MIPPANKCIAKVTDFVTTIACWKSPVGNYIIGVTTLNKEMRAKQSVIMPCNLSGAVHDFNYQARCYGFRKRIKERDFR